MNTEKMLSDILKLKTLMGNGDITAKAIIDSLEESIKQEIRHETAKARGGLAFVKALEKLLAVNTDERWKGTSKQGNTWNVVCPYMGVRLNEKPELEENLNNFDFNGCIPKEFEKEILQLPTIAELKAHIKIQKAENKGKKNFLPTWDFGEGLPYVNANYLLNMQEIFRDVKSVQLGKSSAKWRSPLYFKSEIGDGILLGSKRP